MNPAAAPGTLYIVATPIGNLEDMTYRAVRVLGAVEVVACEDTRHSRKLLEHYGLHRPLVSYYRENEAARGAELLHRLQQGESVALVSDAGTPLVSDPGARLVAAAAAAGIPVVPLPGASAAMAAWAAAGMELSPEAPVALLGFAPARAGARRRWLQTWSAWPGALVMFESPHRLVAALADISEILGTGRRLVVGRELTKLHEEFWRGSVAEIAVLAGQRATAGSLRGEFTLVVGPGAGSAPVAALPAPTLSRPELKRWAREQGLSRSEAYRRLQQGGRPPRGTMES